MLSALIASAIGSSESAVRLLLSLFLGYPLALLYRTAPVYSLGSNVKHLLFTIIGLSICYYNFGLGAFHAYINVTIIYLVLAVFGANKFTVIFSFVFNTCYLVVGYYYQISQEFGLSWTMPHCVLTLRLTAVAFDVYDGQKKSIPNDLKDTALPEQPSYLEMLGHTFFFGGVLVGPQVSMKRYLSFVNGNFSKSNGNPPDTMGPAIQRFLGGFVYIFIFQVFALLVPDSYIWSETFHDKHFLTRCALITIWGKNTMNKYLGVWLVQEGSIILTGMSYNGKDSNGNELWDGCTNVKVWQLETGESLTDYIRSFNVNTNLWMSKYVFKRLRFLGSKLLSQLLTLMYLALWHGLQSGYYMCFLLELIQTNAESQLRSTLRKCQNQGYLPQLQFLSPVGRAIRKFTIMFLMAYSLIAFTFLDWEKWFYVHKSMWFLGHLGPLAVIVVCSLVTAMLPSKHQSNGLSKDDPKELKKEL